MELEIETTIHLIKLCVGAASIDDLAQWQEGRLTASRAAGERPPRIVHTTFQTPKREAELLRGGSLYWVIKGLIQVRQRVIGLDQGTKDDGSACCLIVLDTNLVPVRPVPRRPFQGWRYLSSDDAPPDLGSAAASALGDMPLEMRKDLASLGLL